MGDNLDLMCFLEAITKALEIFSSSECASFAPDNASDTKYMGIFLV